jgi:CRP-like cAMP-binding protein
MNELLRNNIAKHLSLPEAELQQFYDLFEHKDFKRKSYFLSEGQICGYEGFVLKGLFRVFHLDSNGVEQILYFAPEDWWIADIDSFYNQKPSDLFIEALEDSEVLLISQKNKYLAYERFPAIEKLFRIMTQKTHVALQRRMIDNLSKNADQRYLDFIDKYPNLFNRLSNKQIAAYLGISHEFLSKIRNKLGKQK